MYCVRTYVCMCYICKLSHFFSLSVNPFISYIKMTSPNISYFIPVGAILLYCIIIISGMPITGLGNRTVICNVSL